MKQPEQNLNNVHTSFNFISISNDFLKSFLSFYWWNWYFVTKIVQTFCEKKCYSDGGNLLKFEAEGPEFANILRLLEQFIQTVKGQKNF